MMGVWWSNRWRWSLEVIVTILHTGSPWTSDHLSSYQGQWKCWTPFEVTGKPFRTALPTLIWGRGLEKVPQTLSALHIWSAYHGWQIILHAADQWKLWNRNSSFWESETFIHCLIGKSPVYLKGEQPLLLRSMLNIASTLLHWGKREMRLAVEGMLKKAGTGHTFFWWG